ncbi:hypothetical protein GH714_005325 [Hevea brasiliensis]|uniref:Uncharacterized protein n=1 Tax=Hevea brasiliensis TaxID=3981 RepID=A0A6A6KDF3_HEVBR|nr:hypothetical protein GH714_005325 [Hevea brasiliensis]
MVASSESLATRDYSASGYSSRAGEIDTKIDNSNIEEAESSLRESGYLNYEEARALLGRLEYQKGNIEAALHVFEGIDIPAVTSKMKVSISRKCEQNRRRSQSDAAPTMSVHAISLLLEAIFLKTKSLQCLGRFREAAQSCKVILDTVESALPEGLPENFPTDHKLQEILNKAVELLPELWMLAGAPQEAILSYRRALLYHWNLETETTTKIEKILLLFFCIAKFAYRRIGWDPMIIDHLSFALSVSGELKALSHQIEELLPGTMERRERYCTLALCYHGEGEDTVALNLLRNLLNNRENPDCILELLLASKICAENMICVEEGMTYTSKALSELHGICGQMVSVANCLLGLLLSTQSRSVPSDTERTSKKSEALEALETAEKIMRERDCHIIFHLSLENAEQRKLDIAFHYAKQLLKLEAGSSTGKWDQGELLRTKAKLQIAQGQLKDAIQTYTHLLAVVQVRTKTFGGGKKLLKSRGNHDRRLEMETWHDLANVYTGLSQWWDAEICLTKSKAISPYSASRWHTTGLLYEAKGLHQDALKSFRAALDVDPTHVPSLISTASVLRLLGSQSKPIIRSFLTDALQLDNMNHSAWYNLGLLCKDDASASALEAAECFQAAAVLEESAPVEPFR